MEAMERAEVSTVIAKRVENSPDGWEAFITCFCKIGCSSSWDAESVGTGFDGKRVMVEVYVRGLKA